MKIETMTSAEYQKMLNERLCQNSKIKIPLEPVTKKNSQQIFINKKTNRPFITQSERYKNYAKNCKYFLKPLSINRPVNIQYLFYMPTKRKVDLTNLIAAINDILVENRVIIDDNHTIAQSHDGSRVFYDKENPRTEIIISEV